MTNNSLISHNIDGQAFGFSAADVGDLVDAAAAYTIVSIVVDESSSVSSYKKEMENTIKEVIKSCKRSPRSDNLVIRLTSFSSTIREIHGFKLLENCNEDDYIDCLKPGGVTALFDASNNAVTSVNSYGKQLYDNELDVNAIIIIITDGCDNNSSSTIESIKKSLQDIIRSECLESLITILIGVGIEDSYVGNELDKFKKEANLSQYIEMEKADEKNMARMANFVFKNISSQSDSLGSGSASQPLQF